MGPFIFPEGPVFLCASPIMGSGLFKRAQAAGDDASQKQAHASFSFLSPRGGAVGTPRGCSSCPPNAPRSPPAATPAPPLPPPAQERSGSKPDASGRGANLSSVRRTVTHGTNRRSDTFSRSGFLEGSGNVGTQGDNDGCNVSSISDDDIVIFKSNPLVSAAKENVPVTVENGVSFGGVRRDPVVKSTSDDTGGGVAVPRKDGATADRKERKARAHGSSGDHHGSDAVKTRGRGTESRRERTSSSRSISARIANMEVRPKSQVIKEWLCNIEVHEEQRRLNGKNGYVSVR